MAMKIRTKADEQLGRQGFAAKMTEQNKTPKRDSRLRMMAAAEGWVYFTRRSAGRHRGGKNPARNHVEAEDAVESPHCGQGLVAKPTIQAKMAAAKLQDGEDGVWHSAWQRRP